MKVKDYKKSYYREKPQKLPNVKINLYNARPFPEETHRWGWNGVSDILTKHFHDDDAPVMLDAMIEHTFKVGKSKGMDFSCFPHMK